MKKVNDPGRSEVGNDQLEDLAEAMNTLPMSDTGSVETMLLQGGGEGASRSEVHQSSVGTRVFLKNTFSEKIRAIPPRTPLGYI